jgi:plastocyanin
MRTRTLAAVATLVLSASLLLSCFSEHITEPPLDPTSCNVVLPAEAFGSTIVIIRNFAFSQTQVRVRPNTKVTWVNCGAPGDAAHTATADGLAWTSPLLAPGQTFTREFTTVGSFPYHCEPHPGMTATVVVE